MFGDGPDYRQIVTGSSDNNDSRRVVRLVSDGETEPVNHVVLNRAVTATRDSQACILLNLLACASACNTRIVQ